MSLLKLVLDLNALAPEELIALGAAIDADRATLATADAGGMLTALPLCDKVAPGCAELALLDAEGLPASFDLAVTAEFRAQPTSFSDWAIVLELCAGDVDGSGLVDVDDLVAVIVAWSTDDPAADLDGSGTVDVDDLVAVIVSWGCM